MKLFRFVFLLVLLLFFFDLAYAQRDPYEPDTIYFEASGWHSGYTLFFNVDSTVQVDVMAKIDNGVAGFSVPLADTCYDPVSMPTYLDPMKNDPDSVGLNCFTGTAVEGFSILALNLYGTTTPTPPNFLIGGVNFTDSIGVTGVMLPYKLAHLIFTVKGEGCLCLDTISAFYPGGGTLGLSPPAGNYRPMFKFKCFEIRIGEPIRGDVNADCRITLADPIYLANYYLKGGPPPYWPEIGDVNCSGQTNLEDIIYLANYLLKCGPSPCPMEE